MRKNICIFLISVTLLSFGCKEEKNVPTNFDYGKVENGIYKNNFFGIRIPVGDQWFVHNKQQMDRLEEEGKKVIAGDNKELEKITEASMVNVAQLFVMSKYELGSTTDFNPSFLLNVENLKQYPHISTPEEYLTDAKKLLEQSAMNYTYLDEYEKMIGNQKFIALEVLNDDYNINQDYYTTIKNGFALNIVIAYENEQDKTELYNIIDQIKINKNSK